MRVINPSRMRAATSNATYLVTCPDCSTGHEMVVTPPIRVHRMDASGNWEFVETNGGAAR